MSKNRKIFCALLVAFTAIFLGAGLLSSGTAAKETAAHSEERIIILDAGHGGIDGGATSASGLVEKDINLAITFRLRELLELSGFTVILTRESDCSIHDPDATTIRQIKSTDIHNRLKLMNQYPNAVFISIHQNHFTESKYSGAQFFYAPKSDSSKALANALRDSVRALLQPDNAREIKPCGDSVYLIYHASATAVLAECGFLSNTKEAELLGTEEYQQKLAFVLFCGLLEYESADADSAL